MNSFISVYFYHHLFWYILILLIHFFKYFRHTFLILIFKLFLNLFLIFFSLVWCLFLCVFYYFLLWAQKFLNIWEIWYLGKGVVHNTYFIFHFLLTSMEVYSPFINELTFAHLFCYISVSVRIEVASAGQKIQKLVA